MDTDDKMNFTIKPQWMPMYHIVSNKDTLIRASYWIMNIQNFMVLQLNVLLWSTKGLPNLLMQCLMFAKYNVLIQCKFLPEMMRFAHRATFHFNSGYVLL